MKAKNSKNRNVKLKSKKSRLQKPWINYQNFIQKSDDVERDIIASVYNQYFKAQATNLRQRPMSCNPSKQLHPNKLMDSQSDVKSRMDRKYSVSRYSSKISKFPASQLPDELKSLLNDSIRYKNLTRIENRQLEKALNKSKVSLGIEDKSTVEIPNSLSRVSERLTNVSPLSKGKILINIDKYFGQNSPSCKLKSIESSFDKRGPIAKKLFV